MYLLPQKLTGGVGYELWLRQTHRGQLRKPLTEICYTAYGMYISINVLRGTHVEKLLKSLLKIDI